MIGMPGDETSLERTLASLFPMDWVVATAKETGFVRRIRVEMLPALSRHQSIAYDPFGSLHGNFIVQPHESNPERKRLEDIYTKPKYRLKNTTRQ